MIPNGKTMNWEGHKLVFKSPCRWCFFADKSKCPNCDEGLWVEENPSPWHTGTPTEEGLYVVYYLNDNNPTGEEYETLCDVFVSPVFNDGCVERWVNDDRDLVFDADEIVRWQKIEED